MVALSPHALIFTLHKFKIPSTLFSRLGVLGPAAVLHAIYLPMPYVQPDVCRSKVLCLMRHAGIRAPYQFVLLIVSGTKEL